jgi:hypothetical protein
MPVVTRDEFGRRTSDSRFVGLHRPTTGPRQERLLVVTFNGKLDTPPSLLTNDLLIEYPEKERWLEGFGALAKLLFLHSQS